MIKKSYMASLCKNGVLGGAMRVTEEEIVFRTQKLTVDAKYRCLRMPVGRIREIRSEKAIFPTVTITMGSGESYKFIVFGKGKFLESAAEIGVSVTK